MELLKLLPVLERIATSYPQGSDEFLAIENASRALLFIQRSEVRDQFEQFIAESDRPLNGIELIQLKAYGLSIPDDQRTPEIISIESEIDVLAAKIIKLSGKSE